MAGRQAEPTAVILDSRTLQSTPDPKQVAALCERVQQVTGQHVQVAYVDQGYIGEEAEYAAAVHDIEFQVIAKPEG